VMLSNWLSLFDEFLSPLQETASDLWRLFGG